MAPWIYFVYSFYLCVDISDACPRGFSLCAENAETCANTGIIAFGKGDTASWYYKQMDTSFICSQSAFGVDPAPWFNKRCCYKDVVVWRPNIASTKSISLAVGNILCNERKNGWIGDDTEEHILSFIPYSGQTVTFGNCGSDINDTTLHLHDSHGHSLMSDAESTQCDGNDCGRNQCDTAFKEVFTYQSMPFGSYYIRISSNSGSGMYQLFVECTDAPNTPMIAQYSPCQGNINWNINNKMSIVMFQFTAPLPWVFKFECADDVLSWNATLYLYTSSACVYGTEHSVYPCSLAYNQSVYSLPLSSGDYYVMIRNSAPCGSYFCSMVLDLGCLDTKFPTMLPSTTNPTLLPTANPTQQPSLQPTISTSSPSANPSSNPIIVVNTMNPSQNPSNSPMLTIPPSKSHAVNPSPLVTINTIVTAQPETTDAFEETSHVWASTNGGDNLIFIVLGAVTLCCVGIAVTAFVCKQKQESAVTSHDESDRTHQIQSDAIESQEPEEEPGSPRNNEDAETIEHWLTFMVKLPQYKSNFLDNGFVNVTYIMQIENASELQEIGVTKKGHQIRFMAEIKRVRQINRFKEEGFVTDGQ
eukprot:256027_1